MLETIYAVAMTLQNLGVLPWLVSRKTTLPEQPTRETFISKAVGFGFNSYL